MTGLDMAEALYNPCLLLTDLVLIAHNMSAIVNEIPATHFHGCLSQQLLEDNTADDTGDWQTLLHSWVEGVELNIPAQGGSIQMSRVCMSRWTSKEDQG